MMQRMMKIRNRIFLGLIGLGCLLQADPAKATRLSRSKVKQQYKTGSQEKHDCKKDGHILEFIGKQGGHTYSNDYECDVCIQRFKKSGKNVKNWHCTECKDQDQCKNCYRSYNECQVYDHDLAYMTQSNKGNEVYCDECEQTIIKGSDGKTWQCRTCPYHACKTCQGQKEDEKNDDQQSQQDRSTMGQTTLTPERMMRGTGKTKPTKADQRSNKPSRNSTPTADYYIDEQGAALPAPKEVPHIRILRKNLRNQRKYWYDSQNNENIQKKLKGNMTVRDPTAILFSQYKCSDEFSIGARVEKVAFRIQIQFLNFQTLQDLKDEDLQEFFSQNHNTAQMREYRKMINEIMSDANLGDLPILPNEFKGKRQGGSGQAYTNQSSKEIQFQLDPIQVYECHGYWFSYDNRRLEQFRMQKRLLEFTHCQGFAQQQKVVKGYQRNQYTNQNQKGKGLQRQEMELAKLLKQNKHKLWWDPEYQQRRKLQAKLIRIPIKLDTSYDEAGFDPNQHFKSTWYYTKDKTLPIDRKQDQSISNHGMYIILAPMGGKNGKKSINSRRY